MSCLLVLVLHACSCLCRILPRGTWPAHPQPMGLMALTHSGKSATWVLPSTVFPEWTQHWDLGDDRLWGFPCLWGVPDTSSLVLSPHAVLEDYRGSWTRVLELGFPFKSVGVPLPAPQALVTSPSPAAWPLKFGLWTGLFVCSFAWGLILAGCM